MLLHTHTHTHTQPSKCYVFKKSHMLNKAAQLNCNNVKILLLYKYIYFRYNYRYKYIFLLTSQRWFFHQPLLQSSASHDPSEIILKCWFSAQETFLIFVNRKNICAAIFFEETVTFFSGFETEIVLNTIHVCTVTLDQFNASWQNKSIHLFQKY